MDKGMCRPPATLVPAGLELQRHCGGQAGGEGCRASRGSPKRPQQSRDKPQFPSLLLSFLRATPRARPGALLRRAAGPEARCPRFGVARGSGVFLLHSSKTKFESSLPSSCRKAVLEHGASRRSCWPSGCVRAFSPDLLREAAVR